MVDSTQCNAQLKISLTCASGVRKREHLIPFGTSGKSGAYKLMSFCILEVDVFSNRK